MAEIRGVIPDVRAELDHLFRRESGKVVSALVRRFGAEQLDLIEDVVQDVLVQALTDWPFQGMPVKPMNWMLTVAHNRTVDLLRRRAFVLEHHDQIAEHLRSLSEAAEIDVTPDEVMNDDTLRMIFACAHPDLPRESQIILVLRLLFGFQLSAIAAALDVEEAAAAKRLVRAKQKLRSGSIALDLEDFTLAQSRLASALNVLYLTFALGYTASFTAARIRENVCEDSIFLTRLLAQSPRVDDPRVDALLALMLFQYSRVTQSEGLRREAETALQTSARGETISTYHLEAAIASQLSREQPDWTEIVRLYELLALISDSPSVRSALEAAREWVPSG